MTDKKFVIDNLKNIADKNTKDIGFVVRSSLENAYDNDELEYILDIGFINFHHRKDEQTTIYEIVISEEHRLKGWGRLLFNKVLLSSIENNKTKIILKCPINSKANEFYKKLNFKKINVEQGKKRKLNVWEYLVNIPLLFYCGKTDGGHNKFLKSAYDENWLLGKNSSEHNDNELKTIYFVDNCWDKYNHNEHLECVKKHKPLLATIKDVENNEDLIYIKNNIEEFSKYCGRVVIIPKYYFNLKEIQSKFWIGYSIPTRHGKTVVDLKYLDSYGIPIHFLGGSPVKQYKYYLQCTNLKSVDGNYASLSAKYGKTTWQESGGLKMIKGCYETFRLSLRLQKLFWHNNIQLFKNLK